jgi:hypothetical protein
MASPEPPVGDVAASTRQSGWRREAIALLVVAALVSVAALVPMPRVAFALELEAGAAQLTLDEAGQFGGQPLDHELRAEGFSRLESADPSLLQRARDDGASPLAMRAERLTLNSVGYGAGASVGFEAGSPAVRVAIDGAPHSALFEFSGATVSSLGGAPRITTQVPVVEWLRLGADAKPTELWLTRPAERNWRWRGLRPAALRFIERTQEGVGPVRLQSALRRATLRLPATERELRLAEGSVLELDGLRVDQCELGVGDAITLKISGSARRIVVATGGFTQSLSPSLLEYAARNHSLGLLWSAAGLLWGISTWLRKQFANVG